MVEENRDECGECRRLIEAVIEKYSSVSNLALAKRILGRVEGLEIDEDGSVKKGAYPENVKEVVVILKDTVGPVALRFIRDAVDETEPSEKVLEKLPDDFKR